ncbi:unnamed protein product [Fraxinus pennsylvanica]|uniref:Uncharacterized protein n=1 Tax=Fraxinus pennsylvanica TaxID=56036 RepID=A0AAD1Z843_9LAMI|nr:unnamed protein product [Fraxinus pennsylvanica]
MENPRTIRELHRLVKDKVPSLVFLSETKLHRKKMENLRVNNRFDNCFVVDCVGRSGGLAVLWMEDINAEIVNFSNSHISLSIKNSIDSPPWLLSGFYASKMIKGTLVNQRCSATRQRGSGSRSVLKLWKMHGHYPVIRIVLFFGLRKDWRDAEKNSTVGQRAMQDCFIRS